MIRIVLWTNEIFLEQLCRFEKKRAMNEQFGFFREMKKTKSFEQSWKTILFYGTNKFSKTFWINI